MLFPMKLILRWLLLSAALLLVSQWDAGVMVRNFGAAMLASFVLGLLNAVVRPILIILTLPVTLITLGLFLFVINAATFQLASMMLEGFNVLRFSDALLGSALYSLWGLVIDMALERLMPPPRLPGQG
jgi:putative membrane protein